MSVSFDELFQRYYQDVFQFLHYLVRDREQAEDLAQEVFIRVLKSFERFEGRSSEKTWLFSIAKNVAIDGFRKQKGWKQRILDRFDWQRQQVKDSYPIPEEIAIMQEQYQIMYHSLDACTIDQKMVIVMRYIQDLTIAETAEVLGWSVSKVKTTQHRAIKTLKQKMEEQLVKEGDDDEKLGG